MVPEGKTKIIDKKYTIDMQSKPIGYGTYGEVYLAYANSDPSKKLACKVLSKVKIMEKV